MEPKVLEPGLFSKKSRHIQGNHISTLSLHCIHSEWWGLFVPEEITGEVNNQRHFNLVSLIALVH